MTETRWPKEKMMRWVTLYVDAGWKEGRARCGFIARGSVAPTWHQGSGEASCDSSLAAESLAVLYGLRATHAAFSPNVVGGLEGVFLRSDCLTAVNNLQRHWTPGYRKSLKRLKGDTRQITEGIREFCEVHQLRLLAKHVRGHEREPDRIRSWMNQRADLLGNMRGR
jgi:hypothetical protein